MGMSKIAHIIYLSVLSIVVVAAFAIIIYMGFSYYKISMEERFFHPDHLILKPSGVLGPWNGNSWLFVYDPWRFPVYGKKKVQDIFPDWYSKTLARISYFSMYTWTDPGTFSYFL